MVHNEEEYATYERFYTLNKICTSESCVAPSGSSLFYDLDSVAKRKSYSCCNEDVVVGLSTFNIFKALNRKGNEWPRAPAPVHIVQECTTDIKPNLTMCENTEENVKIVKSGFLRECDMASGICLKDNIDDSESSSIPTVAQNRNTVDSNSRVENFVSYQTENVKYERQKTNKMDCDKRNKDPCPCDLDGLGCTCKYNGSVTETKSNKSQMPKQITASTYREEVITRMSTKNKTHLEMEDKLTRMSGDGLSKIVYPVHLPQKDMSCIVILDGYDMGKMSKSQSSSRKSGVRVVRVLTNKVRVKPTKVRTVRCPNCHEHIELAASTEDEASTRAPQPKAHQKSETELTCRMVSSKEKYHPTIEVSKECPHGCEMVPLCQILPKVNLEASSIKQSFPKKTTPRFIKMTKACKHYPPCTAVPSCQRSNVLQANCENIAPCSHRPRCVNLPLCIPFCKNLQYDESTKHYVDNDEVIENYNVAGLKCVPVSHFRLVPPSVISQKQNVYERRPYCVNQTHLSCQVPPINTNQCDNASKSCQYDYPNQDPNNVEKEDTSDASVIYIRDVGCQFKNSSFTPPHTSYYQTRVCYTSSASFDPGSKRLDNIYTNPKAFICGNVQVDEKSTAKCKSTVSISSSTSIVASQMSQQDSKTQPGSNTVAFCMLRNGEGGYLVPVKSKVNGLKGKCKNKFTIQRRQISKVLSNFWGKKQV